MYYQQYRSPCEDEIEDDLETDSAVHTAGDSGLGMHTSSSSSRSTSNLRQQQQQYNSEDDRPILVARDGKSSLSYQHMTTKYSPAGGVCSYSDTRTDSGFASYKSGERLHSGDLYYDPYSNDGSLTSSYHSTCSATTTDSQNAMKLSTTSTTSSAELYGGDYNIGDDDATKQGYVDSGLCLSEHCLSTDSAIDVAEQFVKLNIGHQHQQQYVYSPTQIETSCTTNKVWHSPPHKPKLEENPLPKPEQQTATTFRWIDAFQQDIDGDTTLHLTIIHELTKEVTLLIDHVPHPSFLNLQNNLLQTPLHLAVLTNQPKIVRKLVVSGAALDMRDRKGNTALHLACQEGNLPCTKELLSVCPVTYSDFTTTPYHPLEGYGRIPDLELRNYDGQNCVHLATRRKHLPILQLLKQYGADINAQEGKSGRTALHYAVEARDMELVRFLVRDCYADTNAQTFAGLTPIQLAYINNEPMVHHLLQLGAYDAGPPPSDSESDSSSDEMTSMDTIDDTDCGFLVNGSPLSSY